MNKSSSTLKAILWTALLPLMIVRFGSGEEIEPLAQYETHHRMFSMALSPVGHRLALIDRDIPASVILLEWPSCREVSRLDIPLGPDAEQRRLAHLSPGGEYNVGFDSTGERLGAMGFNHRFYLWRDVQTSNPERVPIEGLESQKNSFWSLLSIQRETSAALADTVNAYALYPHKNIIILGGKDKQIRFWDFNDPNKSKEIKTLDTGGEEVQGLLLSPNGRLLISMGYQSLKLWDVQDPASAHFLYGLLKEPFKPWGSVVFSPDSKLVAYAGFKPGSQDTEGAVVLFDVTNPTLPQEMSLLSCYHDAPSYIAVSPDGKQVAAGFLNGTVSIWDITNPFLGRLIRTFKAQNEPANVLFSPGKNTLLTLNNAGILKEWSIQTNPVITKDIAIPNLKRGDLWMVQVKATLSFVTYPGIPYIREQLRMSPDHQRRNSNGVDYELQALTEDQAIRVLNAILKMPDFYSHVDDKRIPGLPFSVLSLLGRAKNHESLSRQEIRLLNKNLLVGVLGRQAFTKWKGFDESWHS